MGRLQFDNRLHQRDPWPPEQEHPGPAAATRSAADFLDAVLAIGTGSNGVFSIKCHWFQLQDFARHADTDDLERLFPAVRHVRLIRRDKVQQAISWQRATTTDVWASVSTPHRTRTHEPTYDADVLARLRDELARYERGWDAYFAARDEPIVITYEDLARDYEGTLRRLLDTLGLSSASVRIDPPRLAKQAGATSGRWAARLIRSERKRPAMRTSIIAVDNFYANPTAVRDYALKQDYYLPYQSAAQRTAGRPVTWMTSRFKAAADCPFKSSLELVGRLEEITGDCIDLDHWNLDFPLDPQGRPSPAHRDVARSCLWNCSFHLKPETGQQLGDGVHNHVTDSWNSVLTSGWAGLLYLNPDAPPRGGLHLWRNVDSARNYDWMTPKEHWELVDDLGNVPNRLLLCRGDIPHSGARGWGSGLDDGRLYQTFFFRVRPRRPPDGVLAAV